MSSTSRRTFLRNAGVGAAAVAVTTGGPATAAWAKSAPTFSSSPWALGVASGDPSPDGFVLWTRLATDDLGVERIKDASINVRWEVAADSHFKKIVARGTEVAQRGGAHSVHAEVAGLEPHREYWYRFKAGDEISPVGRTKTAPKFGAAPAAVTFAFASCQQYENGYYAAWADVAKQDLDVVLHLGDYIYEGKTGAATQPRQHVGPEIETLFQYRRRYAQYKSDANLQAAHHAHPFIVVWDDHEVDNNYADLISENDDPIAEFRKRRAAAYKAYYEHMPLRRKQVNRGPNLLLDRAVPYGDLVQFTMLDSRQYRSDQANGDGNKPPSAEWADPRRTYLGDDQEARVLRNLRRSGAKWNIIGNQVMMTGIDYKAGAGEELSMDQWSGYPVARERFLDEIVGLKVQNPVFVTGDVHSSWANEVNHKTEDPASPIVCPEFTGTSITSGGDGDDKPFAALSENPQVKFQRNRRGYVKVALTKADATVEFRHLKKVSEPGAAVYTDARFGVKAGQPTIERL